MGLGQTTKLWISCIGLASAAETAVESGLLQFIGQELLEEVGLENLGNYGCWCAGIDANDDSATYGIGDPLDDLDRLCKEWFTARHCTTIQEGSCFNYWAEETPGNNGYITNFDDATVTDYCQPDDPTNECGMDVCKIDMHFVQLIRDAMAAGAYNSAHENPSLDDCHVDTGGGPIDVTPTDEPPIPSRPEESTVVYYERTEYRICQGAAPNNRIMKMDKYECPHPLEFSDTLSLFDLHGGMESVGAFDCGWEISMAGADQVAFYFRLFETTMNMTNHGDLVTGDLTLRYDYPVACNEWDNRIQIESEVDQIKLCGFQGQDVPNDFVLALGPSSTFRLRISMRDYSGYDQATIQWKQDAGTGPFLTDSIDMNWRSQNTFAVEVGIKGDWGVSSFCDEGKYVCGMQSQGNAASGVLSGLKVQCCSFDQAQEDSVALANEVLVSSGEGQWLLPKYCVQEAQHVCGLKTKYDSDSAITGIDMSCCGTSTGYIQETIKPAKVIVHDGPTGEWKASYTNCDYGNYVCGLQSRYFANDDQLQGLKVVCCKRMAFRDPLAAPTEDSWLSSVAAYNEAGYLNPLGFQG